jgi:hypothetical protein
MDCMNAISWWLINLMDQQRRLAIARYFCSISERVMFSTNASDDVTDVIAHTSELLSVHG